jgi:hypothetical protein
MAVILYDSLAIKVPVIGVALDADGRRFDFNMDKAKAKAKGPMHLLVTVDTSHSGRLTNYRCYPGRYMKASAKTWTRPYKKPILPRHPSTGLFTPADEPDALGRVQSAKFFRLTEDDEAFDNDYKEPMVDGLGSGYVQTVGKVSDEEAVQKFIDGRYLTVSAGMISDNLICSICNHDWAKTRMPCEHDPGRVYEIEVGDSDSKKKAKTVKRLAYHITGKLDYDHWATVNTPADAHAVVVSTVLKDGLVDGYEEIIKLKHPDQSEQQRLANLSSLVLVDSGGAAVHLCLTEDEYKDAPPAIRAVSLVNLELPTPDQDPKEGDMKGKKKDTSADQKGELETKPDEKPAEQPEKKPSETEPEEKPEEKKEEKKEEGKEEPKPEEATEEEATEEEEEKKEEEEELDEDARADLDTLGSILDAIEADPANSYDWVAADISPEKLEKIRALDKKLTTKTRKALPDEVFCGPDRSFPVQDCAHYTNAKARLANYKGTGSKATIRTCIERKGKTLKCSTAGKKGDTSTEDQVVDKKQDTAEVASLQHQVTNLRASLDSKVVEVTELLGQLADRDEQLHTGLAKHILLYRQLLNRRSSVFEDTAAYEAAVEKLAERSYDYLIGTVEDLREDYGNGTTDRGSVSDDTAGRRDDNFDASDSDLKGGDTRNKHEKSKRQTVKDRKMAGFIAQGKK